MSKVFVHSWRSIACCLGLLLGFSGLFSRLVWLHLLEADALAEEASANRRQIEWTEARRGNIYDRHGDLLAGTRTRIRVGLDPHSFDDDDQGRLAHLAAILELDYKTVLSAAKRKFRTGSDGEPRPIRWVPLAAVTEDVYHAVQNLGIRAVYGNRFYERYYPGGKTAGHLLGYLNREDTPVFGLERALDFYLVGQGGWREVEVDGRRREIPVFETRTVQPTDGHHVTLTIDLYVQSVVEEVLAGIAETFDPAGATIIVSRPDSGEILGLGNYPSFDPNHFRKTPIAHQRNRAVTDVYEPGSTFKIVAVAAAIEEGLVSPDSLIECGEAVVDYRGRPIRMPSDHKNLGTIPVYEVVAKSSNRGAAQLGMMLGDDRMYAYAKDFGFGNRTGWFLGGEVRGTLHPVKDWDGLTISRLPTGYAMNATPMQVHLAMSTIANDGTWIAPRILQRVFDDRQSPLLSIPPAEKRTVIREDTARTVREMLPLVPTRKGTARRAAIDGYTVAGKTGTSRKIIDGVYSSDHHIGSFSGFFPARDPEIVITIMVDDPKLDGPGYGGVVAAPAFREIGSRLIPHLAIQKPEPIHSFVVAR